tara:strand:- start:789 stop:1316 length:528 start_codon:yes stop_codon:yes gene_type:complete
MIAQTLIINRQQIESYNIQLSQSIYDNKLNQLIQEAQFNDLRPLLGTRFYNDILKKISVSDTTYDDLLNGSEYEYMNETYFNYGLRIVLSYYTFARWSMFGDITDTPFGQTKRTNTELETPLTIAEKKQAYNNNQNIAWNYWLSVKDFLNRNYKDYELYDTCLRQKPKFKLYKLG